MASPVAALIVRVAADLSELKTSVGEIDSKLGQIESIAKKAGSAIAGVFAVEKIVSAGEHVIEYSRRIADMSEKLHISTTTAQQWEAAFAKSGVPLEMVAKAAEQLSIKLIGGDAGAVGALEKMGFNLNALKQMTPEARFNAVADAIGKIQNPAEQLYASKTLMGKGGPELLAALDGHLQETIDHLTALGVVIDEKTIKAADDFGDEMGVLEKVGTALIAQVLVPILPGLMDLAKWLASVASGAITLAKNLEDSLIKKLLEAKAAMLEWLYETANAIQNIPLLGKHLGITAGMMDSLRNAAAEAHDQVKLFSTAAVTSTESTKQHTTALAGFGKAAKDSGGDVAELKGRVQTLGEEERKTAKITTEELGKSIGNLETALRNGYQAVDAFGRYFGGGFPGALQAGADAEVTTADKTKMMEERFKDVREAMSKFTGGVPDTVKGATDVGDSVKFTAEQIRDLEASLHTSVNWGKNILSGLNESFTKVGPALVAALEGGGDKLRSVASAMGTGFSQKLFGNDAFKDLITKHFGDSLGGMFNSILPGIGALAGPLISKIASLFGKTEWDKNFEKMAASVETARQSIISSYGSLDALKGMAGETGTALYNAFQEKGTQAILNQTDALKNFNAVMAETDAAAAEYGLSWQNLDDAHMPAALAADVGGLQRKTDELITRGYAYNDVIKAMAPKWNEAAQAAIRSGASIDASFLPIFADLETAGLLVDAAGHKLHVVSHDGVLAFTVIGDAAVAATTQASAALDGLISKWRVLSGFNGGSAGEGTSEGKGESHILDGMSEDDARNVYLNAIANQGSTDQDWDRVKSQYGFSGGSNGLRDFGSGTMVTLHGREEVRTEAQVRAADKKDDSGQWYSMLGGKLDSIERLLKDQPRAWKHAMQTS